MRRVNRSPSSIRGRVTFITPLLIKHGIDVKKNEIEVLSMGVVADLEPEV